MFDIYLRRQLHRIWGDKDQVFDQILKWFSIYMKYVIFNFGHNFIEMTVFDPQKRGLNKFGQILKQ